MRITTPVQIGRRIWLLVPLVAAVVTVALLSAFGAWGGLGQAAEAPAIDSVSGQRVSLPGPFPSVEDISANITHVRTVMVPKPEARNRDELPAPVVTNDAWSLPGNSAYRHERRMGDTLSVRAFDGREYWGYNAETNGGYRFSKDFVLQNLEGEFGNEESNVAKAERQDALDKIATGQLAEKSKDTLDDRSVLTMEDTGGTYVRVVLDELTSLPLVVEDHELTAYKDYERLDPAAATAEALFGPAFPADCKVWTEDQSHSSLQKVLPLAELAGETTFTLLSAGSSFQGFTLVKSELWPDGSVEMTYSRASKDLSGTTFLVTQWRAGDAGRTATLRQGMEGAGYKPEKAGPDGQWTLYRGGVGGPRLSLVIGDTFVVVTLAGGPDAESAVLLELASRLTEVQ